MIEGDLEIDFIPYEVYYFHLSLRGIKKVLFENKAIVDWIKEVFRTRIVLRIRIIENVEDRENVSDKEAVQRIDVVGNFLKELNVKVAFLENKEEVII